MKAKKIIRISLISLLLVAIVGYLVYAMVFMSKADPTEQCVELVMTVDKASKTQFVDKSDVEDLLKKANVYPVGRLMADISTNAIEETVVSNDFVEQVECYKSSKGKVCLKVRLRQPVIYILPDGQSGYFVDAKGTVIPNTHYAENLVTASGQIDEQFATTQLAQFGMYLQQDEFWNSQIEQIYVMRGRKAPQIEIIPRVGEHVISLGSIDDYEKKLSRLKVFYQKAMGTVGWNKYSRISIEYDRQIICTKKGKEAKR